MEIETTDQGLTYVRTEVLTRDLRAYLLGSEPDPAAPRRAERSSVFLHVDAPVAYLRTTSVMADCQATVLGVGADSVTLFTEPEHMDSLIAAFDEAAGALRRLR